MAIKIQRTVLHNLITALSMGLGLIGAITTSASATNTDLVRQFAAAPVVDNIEISPDGKLLAWVNTGAGNQAIEVHDIAAGASKLRVDAPEGMRLHALYWHDNDNLLVMASIVHTATVDSGESKYDLYRYIAIHLPTGKSQILLHQHKMTGASSSVTLVARSTTRPHKVMLAAYDYSSTSAGVAALRVTPGRRHSGWLMNLYEVDIISGAVKETQRGTSFTYHWVVDQHGDVVARAEWDPTLRRYTVQRHERGRWITIYEQILSEAPQRLLLTEDGSALWLQGTLDGYTNTLSRLSLQDGSMTLISEDSIMGLLFNPHTNQPARLSFVADRPHQWLDPRLQSIQTTLEKSFAGREVWLESTDQAMQRHVVAVNDPSHPITFYLVDYATRTADIITEAYTQLVDRPMARVETFSYLASDGQPITAYLTRPMNSTATPPLIVLPHRGPGYRDTPDYNWLAQFMVAKGYAVLQPQFRGSAGFGQAYRRAGDGQWGRLMQDDLTDGVQYLIKEGKADASRICIAGIEYGGYAALAGAAFTPDLYACAISINGIAHLPRLLRSLDDAFGKESSTLLYWQRSIGLPASAEVINASPTRAADKITAKVLLLHTEDHGLISIEHARLMQQAMPASNPARLVTLPGADQQLLLSSTRTLVLQEIAAFLDQHLPASAAAPTAD